MINIGLERKAFMSDCSGRLCGSLTIFSDVRPITSIVIFNKVLYRHTVKDHSVEQFDNDKKKQ